MLMHDFITQLFVPQAPQSSYYRRAEFDIQLAIPPTHSVCGMENIMNLIVAADRNWGIGRKGEVLVSIPDDMKNFRELTEGNVVVMGRKTFESLPGKRPLTNRVNIILTSKKDYSVKGAVVANSLEQLDEILSGYDNKKVFVMGGGQVYNLLIDRCDTAYVTFIDYKYDADTFCPPISPEEWKLVEESEEQTYFDVEYYYRKYIRK